jgi:hypothetical protein
MNPLTLLNQLSVRDRKIAYAVIGAVMLVPILLLGQPANLLDQNGTPVKSGGTIAQMRFDYELGEASLGNVDPTSSAFSFGLLGFRGIVASMLWMKADDLKTRKEFHALEETVESIILLQPHFRKVWEFQGWNLAFNLSAECDDVKDRYRWVKEGARFMMRGTERNRYVPELHWQTGYFFGTKIGRADEREEYRRYFISDPDPELDGRPDPQLNPEGKGNYLVARDWYLLTNKLVDAGREQHQMDSPLLLSYPYAALSEHATVLREDGVQLEGMPLARREEILEALAELSADDDPVRLAEKRAQLDQAYAAWKERCRKAWDDAHDEWVNIYGRKLLTATDGNKFILEDDPAVAEQLARDIASSPDQLDTARAIVNRWQSMYRRTTNYPQRKQRCDIERREQMALARYQLIEGKRLFVNMSNFTEARKLLLEGLKNAEAVVMLYERQDGSNGVLIDEPEIVEDLIKAQILYEQSFALNNEPKPTEFPLKALLWDSSDEAIQNIKQDALNTYQRQFGYQADSPTE